VPATHPLRPGAETWPWAALVAAVDRSFAQRFPTPTARGRPPVSTRVLWAGARLHQELACADEPIWSRWRTALAVMSAGGSTPVQGDQAQEQCVRPAGRAPSRRRRAAPLMAALLALQAAPAMADGVVSPAPLGGATVPRAQGRPRGTAAAPLEKAPKKASNASRPSPRPALAQARCARGTRSSSRLPFRR
jgi:hypothetical protein